MLVLLIYHTNRVIFFATIFVWSPCAKASYQVTDFHLSLLLKKESIAIIITKAMLLITKYFTVTCLD